MGRSTVEIWNAGGKVLAILILLFSGIWPYTKQAITLVLWFASPRTVSVEKRGSLLLWLDTLAKWSIVDIFVLIVTVAGFRVSVRRYAAVTRTVPRLAFMLRCISPIERFSPGLILPDNFYSVNLLVVPMWGLYANLIAQLLSQISSHVIVHYHRSIVKAATSKITSAPRLYGLHGSRGSGSSSSTFPTGEANDESIVRLCEHGFSRPHRGEAETLVVRRHVNAALKVTAICTGILVVCGCLLPSFSIRILGIIGVMVESGQRFQDATTEYSLFGVLNLLIDQAALTTTASDYVGLGALTFLMVVTVLIVPVAQSFFLVYLWLCPLSSKWRGRVALWVEILSAWQYADVYLLAVVIASWYASIACGTLSLSSRV
jgi:Paraquat-inducible protein A